MVKQAILPPDEPWRKADAIKTLSLGLFAATVAGEILIIIFRLFHRDFPLNLITIIAAAVMLTSALTYWLTRAGQVKFAGYFFIISLMVVFSVATYSFGGAAGPMAITYIFPIMVATLAIGLRSTFLVATIASLLLLVTMGIETTELLPQQIEGEWHEIATGSTKEIGLTYIALGSKLIFFYLVAFLSWFTVSRLDLAVRNAYHNAAVLQAANEKLQASEEEFRASNEELEAANEELRATEERLRLVETAVDASISAVGITDLNGKLIYANPAHATMFGYDNPEEMLGMGVIDLAKEKKEAQCIIETLMAGGIEVAEIVLNRRDGTEFIAELRASTITDATGQPIGTTASLADVTERQQMEQAIHQKNEEMEATNLELKEAQEQLVRSEKLAAIGQLAGGVGHELRNPLGAIKNAVYYIRGKVAKSEIAQQEPRVMEFLDIMDEEINSSNKIINDLLGFSRVGKPAVSPARIEKVINDAIMQNLIPENIEFTKKLGDGLPEVEIDTGQIRQVLINMITNALQAMPEGGKLTIGARTVDSSLQVEITDTGVGIAKENIDKIFDPLYTMKAKGIGLGLAVCKSIIERHEGHIEVKSRVDRGTTFTIRLPLKVG